MGMNPDVKAKWVSALRSGEYTQATEKLTDVDTGGDCCLGVLCKIAVSEGVIEGPIRGGLSDRPDPDGYKLIYGRYDEEKGYHDYSSTSLPDAVKEWAGLSDDNPSVSHTVTVEDDVEWSEEAEDWVELDPYDTEISDSLAELNDSHGKNFNELADLIDSQL